MRTILKPMINTALSEKPKDPIGFMIQWLQKYSGTEVIGENIEKNELKNLRREIKHYKKKYEKEEQEIVLLSDQEEKESPEDQERIDEEIKKKHQKKKVQKISY
jgi:hypothetical protein